MYFWKDKQGNKLSKKEFFERFKEGIEGVTPLQQTKMQLNSFYIIIIGIGCGIVICFFSLKTLWWLLIILIGAMFNSVVQLLGTYQKYLLLKKVYDNFEVEDKEVEDGIR